MLFHFWLNVVDFLLRLDLVPREHFCMMHTPARMPVNPRTQALHMPALSSDVRGTDTESAVAGLQREVWTLAIGLLAITPVRPTISISFSALSNSVTRSDLPVATESTWIVLFQRMFSRAEGIMISCERTRTTGLLNLLYARVWRTVELSLPLLTPDFLLRPVRCLTSDRMDGCFDESDPCWPRSPSTDRSGDDDGSHTA